MSAGDVFEHLQWLKEFTVTEQHLTLLRNACVGWDPFEYGAPAIDAKRPYGNSDVIGDMARILGEQVPDAADDDEAAAEQWYDDNEQRLERLHAETAVALQICLCLGEFRTGTAVRDREFYARAWRWVS